VPACGTINSDTTWTTGNVYVVQDCNLIIAAGVTLTIQPGVIVKLGGTAPGYGSALGSVAVIVYGRLDAIGTADQPVVFTSLKDDARGGDTNENGPSSGAAGDWYGIVFWAGSNIQLEHFFVGYAGSVASSPGLGYSRSQVDVRQATVQLRNGVVTSGRQKGIYLEGAGLTPVIENVQVANNRASQARGYAIYQSTINMQPTYTNLAFTDNDRDAVIIGNFGDPMTQNVTLSRTTYGVNCGFTGCQLLIPAGYTLTVQPGVVWDFGWDAYPRGLGVASGGTLVAEGTPEQPIIFTSGQGTAHYWPGIWAQQGSTLRLSYCDISYAYDSNYGYGGLEINTSDAQVRNCRIHHNRDTGLLIYSRDGASIAPSLVNVEVSNNGGYGVYLMTSRGSVNAPVFAGGRIADNGYSGVYIGNFANVGVVQATLRDVTISGNGSAARSPHRPDGIYAPDPNTSLTLENLTLTNNVGAAIFWYCSGSIAARSLTATGNGQNELLIPGCSVSGGRQWDLGDAGLPVRVTYDIDVMTNALLSILPGTVLRFDKNQFGSPTRLGVRDQATLNALGTADRRVVFTGATATPGWWTGIHAYQRATLTLRHCEIGYGGNRNRGTGSLVADWGWPDYGVPVVNVQHCEIHHSGLKGVHFDFDTDVPITALPVFRYNNLHDNAEEAVTNWNAPTLDARHNYWGDSSGPYHATQNPGGQGDSVGNNILFYPWLTEPGGGEVSGEMQIMTGAPHLISPGQSADYAIQYSNQMSATVQNAILLIQLPQAADYISSTGGGIYWPERHQVFWKLGDLPPGAQGYVSVLVRFQWGLTRDYRDGSITLLAAENYNADRFNRAEYPAYQPVTTTVFNAIGQAEFDALRNGNAELQTLYQQTFAQGYRYLEAGRVTFSDGTTVSGAVFRTPDRRSVRLLTLYEGRAMAITSSEGQYALHNTTGGMTTTLATFSREYWGDWAADTDAQTLTVAGTPTCSSSRCKFNCIGKKVTFKYVTYSLGKMFFWTIATGGGGGLASGAYHTLHVTKMIYDCNNECNTDPNSNCCAAGQVRWTLSGWSKLFGSACVKEECSATTGTYGTPGTIYCAGGQRCVAGQGSEGGCKDCVETLNAAAYRSVAIAPCAGLTSLSRCSDLEALLAKDPNAIYGPEGDLLPGQVITYTITYENEGEGRAYGVYVVNQLPAVFNADTITFVSQPGTYLPDSREIIWSIGELAPKGQTGSTGVITYTVALTGGLASGTVVANQAVVYFPSVPEETPTNTWVNLVTPLVAIPQALTPNYMTPLTITLSGRDVSGLPLTYEVVEMPHGGTLTGTAPTVTYTPAANFTGVDAFTFRVSNGTSTSRETQVRIEVLPVGDTTPPTVMWVSPAADAAVTPTSTPIFTDTTGPVYGPAILIGMSEALDDTTVTTASVTLRGRNEPLPALVTFDRSFNQIVVRPRAMLADGTYTVTVSQAVSDPAGNALTAPFTATFTVGDPRRQIYVPMVMR